MTIPNLWGFPDLGIGVGLRATHYPYILENRPPVDWFEIISENYMNTGGRPMDVLLDLAEQYPIVMHGVAMSPGSTDPIDFEYLKRLKELADKVNARWLGDHICWTGVAHHTGHDLYPLPTNMETLEHLSERVRIIQDYLERPLVLENPSTYLSFHSSTMTEWDFITALCEQTRCGLLLDVNNIYVSSRSHGFDPMEYLHGIPLENVVQVHLAGHLDKGTHCIDTHDAKVCDAVWELYAEFCRLAGNRSTLLEWDDQIPSFPELHEEALRATRFRSGLTPEEKRHVS